MLKSRGLATANRSVPHVCVKRSCQYIETHPKARHKAHARLPPSGSPAPRSEAALWAWAGGPDAAAETLEACCQDERLLVLRHVIARALPETRASKKPSMLQ